MAEESTDESGEPQSLFLTLQTWVKDDRRELLPWYKEAKRDYEFKSGGEGQWEPEDLASLRDQKRPHTSFNFIGPSVNSVAGMEVSNRQEVTYLPRTTQTSQQQTALGQPGMPVPGADDTGPAEIFTAAAKYFRDQCDAEDEESDSFLDCATCGVGFTETRIDYDEDPAGKMVVDRCDPLEMGWDHRSSKRNMVDSRRFHRIREMDKRAALEMFDGHDIDEIDASWARPHNFEAEDHLADKEFAYLQGDPKSENKNTVHVVEITWFETKTSYIVSNRGTGEVMEVEDRAELKKIRDRAKTAGLQINVANRKSRVYKQAFLGSSSILEEMECQSQKGFKFNAITGTRDRNKRQWTGIVRAMRDPQRWANALYSSVLNTIMTSGKGIMAERSAFEKPDEAEANWANAGKITFLKEGALSGQNPKVVPKAPSNLPPAIFEMMQFAMQALRDVSGVNIETLGLADREQAASLEYQRRQAATTILAPFFDGLRRYRKEQGRLMLDLIKNYLSDGRLIRIVGPEYEGYIPLIKDESISEFDIIVSESPTSPNQKEASWMMLQQILPVMGKNMGPGASAVLLKASPLPTTVVKEFEEAAEKDREAAANQPPPPDVLLTQAQVAKTEAETVLKQQEAAIRQVEGASQVQMTQLDMAERAEQRQHEMAMRAMEFQQAQQKHAMEMESRSFDLKARQAEMQGDSDREFARAAGTDVPAKMEALSQGLVALGEGIAKGMQAQAQAIESLAKATAAPRKTDLIWQGGMPVSSVSSVQQVQ